MQRTTIRSISILTASLYISISGINTAFLSLLLSLPLRPPPPPPFCPLNQIDRPADPLQTASQHKLHSYFLSVFFSPSSPSLLETPTQFNNQSVFFCILLFMRVGIEEKTTTGSLQLWDTEITDDISSVLLQRDVSAMSQNPPFLSIIDASSTN